ncbi:hypothetical protein J4730_06695 [Klebsiella pneumoniae]|uniref:Uncharacterized protein n=1 Tax=Klebsiella pneumoniae TaxID=573 RepID=A0A939NN83_KLEPN|nr:hypothetical protein [Klebsiella pneumoniae]
MAALFRQRNNNNPGSLSRPGKAVAGSVTPPRYQGVQDPLLRVWIAPPSGITSARSSGRTAG